jgi:hypothetical protein
MNFLNPRVSIGIAGLLGGLICAATASAQTGGGCETKARVPNVASAATAPANREIAAGKAAFDEQIKQLQSDPAVQAQIAEARTAFAVAMTSPELAAQRAAFDRQMAALEADPAVQAQIAKARQQFQELASDPSVEQQRAAMNKQLDTVRNAPEIQKQRTQASDPCKGK